MSAPKAYLIEWESEGEPRARVQLDTRMEPWLERYAPKITPLFTRGALNPPPPSPGERLFEAIRCHVIPTLVEWPDQAPEWRERYELAARLLFPPPSPGDSWRPSHVHADGGEYRFVRHMDGRVDQHEDWRAGVLYEGADGRYWWTGNDRWFDRFYALPLTGGGGKGSSRTETARTGPVARPDGEALPVGKDEP